MASGEGSRGGRRVTEEEVLDGVIALGKACAWMEEYDGCKFCYDRAKGGYDRLLGEDHAKSADAT